MLTILLLASLLSGNGSPPGTQQLVVSSGVRELKIVSLYIWEPGNISKGENLLPTELAMGSCASVPVPTGKLNILAFDEAGNSYGLQGLEPEDRPDTLRIDNSMITFGRPNFDRGTYMLNITNALQGFPIDSIALEAEDAEILEFGGLRLFPGSSAFLWLDEGVYDIHIMDGLGRWLHPGAVSVPSDSPVVAVTERHEVDPPPPLGICGEGTEAALLQNCLWRSAITRLELEPEGGVGAGLYLDDLGMQPGDAIVLQLDPGGWKVNARDTNGTEYLLEMEVDSSVVGRFFITNDEMLYDFGFPQDRE